MTTKTNQIHLLSNEGTGNIIANFSTLFPTLHVCTEPVVEVFVHRPKMFCLKRRLDIVVKTPTRSANLRGKIILNELMKAARPSTVGDGCATALVESVRKSNSIANDTHGFTFALAREEIARRFLERTLYQPVRLEFNKLVIYQPGDFFDTHRDRVHGPNHVGTFLVGTPYKYSGGALTLDTQEFTLSHRAHVFIPNTMWHSVAKVEAGTRVVAQFSVYRQESSQPMSDANTSEPVDDSDFSCEEAPAHTDFARLLDARAGATTLRRAHDFARFCQAQGHKRYGM